MNPKGPEAFHVNFYEGLLVILERDPARSSAHNSMNRPKLSLLIIFIFHIIIQESMLNTNLARFPDRSHRIKSDINEVSE